MTQIPLIIDGDPGVDDAIALLLAFGSPELEILGVTTTMGNVGPELTARNARIIRQIAGREEVPVHAGARLPLVRAPVEAGHFHGQSGLGTLPIFEPAAPAGAQHAANFIVEAVMARPPGTVSLAVMGPMTNLALALRLEPTLAGRLKQVVAMGGARREGGNITASAEFNIFADPHAAHVVAESGANLVMLGLDATHQVRSTPARRAAIAALKGPVAAAATTLLAFSLDTERRLVGDDDPPLHDPCTIAYVLRPDLFETHPCRMDVEIASELAQGHTAVDLRLSDGISPNARWAVKAQADGVYALLTERLAR